jgi:predicted Zn-dependent peptidase
MMSKNNSFFERTELPSGITVITETMPQVRSVAIGFWVGVGSRDETDEVNGMSHFLEHLMFKGTQKRTAMEISEAFDTLGGELNAFTAKEYTCYYARLLDQHVPDGLEILSDMVQNSKFDAEDITSERKVVIEEINRNEDTPDDRIHDLFVSSLWPDHPLGKPILGHSEIVGNFSREDVVNFYQNEYGYKNLVVAAAGNIEHQLMVDRITSLFQGIPGEKPVHKEFKPSVQQSTDVHTKKTEQAHIVFGTEALHAGDDRRFILSIMDNILGGGMSSRLFQEIREKKGMAYSTYSYHSLYRETGFLAAYAGTTPDNTEEVVRLMKEQFGDLASGGVTDQEVYRAKEHIKGQLMLGLESTGRRMTRLGKLETTKGELLSMDELVERVESVTRDDISALAADLLNPNKMVLTVIGPFEPEQLLHLNS